MMHRNFGFGRLEPLAAMPLAFSAPSVTAALAEELFGLHRAPAWRAAKTPCAVQAKAAPKYEAAA